MNMSEKPSLLIIGNSNVGKSSITKLLLKNPKQFKGKTGKTPGSTLLIKPITQHGMDFQIVDLPGFGYMRKTSKRREEHIKNQVVRHIEKHNEDYFFGLVVLNILRIEDELEKYFIKNTKTIPLSFELISFLREFKIPMLVVVNKIDKVSKIDVNRIIGLLVEASRAYGLNLVHLTNFQYNYNYEIPFLEFSALKKTNLGKLKKIVYRFLNQ
jgi:small GTP-binding protein